MPSRSHVLLCLVFCLLIGAHILAPKSVSQSSQKSLSLNGTSQYISVPYSSSIDISGPITVEAWVKLNSVTGLYRDIVCREAYGQTGSGGGYELSITDTGKLRFDLFHGPWSYTGLMGTTTLSANTWHHVAGVYDGSYMRVYVDGNLDGSLSTGNGPASGNSSLNIGKSTYTGYYFGGLIDEVRISAAALYNSNFTAGLGPANNTRALWKFDGQVWTDSSGNGNTGSPQNTPAFSSDVPSVSNTSPTVNLKHPLTNAAFGSPATVVIDADAADSDGINKVEFYQGPTLLNTDTSAPYLFVWTNVSSGNYSITAKAFDNFGASTLSSAIPITVVSQSSQKSLSLNGTSQYISVPYSSSIDISGPITVEAWVKLNSVTGLYRDIVCREAYGQTGSGGGYELSITDTGKLRFDLFHGPWSYTGLMGTTTLSASTWHHVAGVYDGSYMRVYVDGNLDGSLSTGNGPASGNSSLNIGKSTYTGYYFGGLIDEVRISAAALYNSNFTAGLGPANNTRALWKFDGQVWTDSSGNGNTGSPQNTPAFSSDVPSGGSSGSQPVANAHGPYTGQSGQAVTFSSANSSDPDGTVVAYHWNFGDGLLSSDLANPSHTYQATGSYTATLTVTDNSGLRSSATSLVTINGSGSGSTDARTDPRNQTGGGGENPLSQNYNWTLPLVSLPGRAGLDLNLSLSYNSLVWTKNGNTITWDQDNGRPAPGFRLGFPIIQSEYLNSETGKWSYLLIASDGGHTELRRVATNIYQSADSSYLLLDTSNLTTESRMVLRTTDGTQLTYRPKGTAYECTEIKDRNGNFLTINYTTTDNLQFRISSITDTLGRVITFYYENDELNEIRQVWNQGVANPPTHVWAKFVHETKPIQTNFNNLSVSGPSSFRALTKVYITDNSHDIPTANSRYEFAYTSWGQVWKISGFAPNGDLLNFRAYDLPQGNSPAQDCPRFTERRDWAKFANGDVDGSAPSDPFAGTSELAVTTFSGPIEESNITMPDATQVSGTRADVVAGYGTSDQVTSKIYYRGTATSQGWRRGLVALVKTLDSNGTVQRQVMTNWEQDHENVSYQLNPRVKGTDIYDPSGNRKLTELTYEEFQLAFNTVALDTKFNLPSMIFEYAANSATTKLRTTHIQYSMTPTYKDRWILGLVSEKKIYQGSSTGTLMSRVGFAYDESGSVQGGDAPVQHDNTNYTGSFVGGRGNLSSVTRYNVKVSGSTTSTMKYNVAGSVVQSTDAVGDQTTISYADSFSAGGNRNTLAYPTKLTDADQYYSLSTYNYDFGALTYRQTPPPNYVGIGSSQPSTGPDRGPEQAFEYYDFGRLKKQTNLVNGAYTSIVYEPNGIRTDINSTIQDGAGESHSFSITDGMGQQIATAVDNPDNPGKTGAYRAQKFKYDVLGRLAKTSNPAETNGGVNPIEWSTTDHDEASTWLYTEQKYDWKGRPVETINVDTTKTQTTYVGCGCAGGEIVEFTDEGIIVDGVTKKRFQRLYSDVLGRTVRAEVWDFEGTSGAGRRLDSTTLTSYNARDQVTSIRQFAGNTAPSPELDDGVSCPTGTCQKTKFEYDGYGRVESKHAPEQNATAVTSWTYKDDDTIWTVLDGRGALSTYSYGTKRKLVTGLTHSLSGSPTITVGYEYDAAGNRKSMSHSIAGDPQDNVNYVYDQLSRLTSETRHINSLSSNSQTGGNYTIGYEYTLSGQLKSVTDPFAATTNMTYDATGRTLNVTGTYGGQGYSYVDNIGYRAWGGIRSSRFNGNSTQTIEYNTRLLPAKFRHGVRYDYSYHPDGKLKHITDLDDFFAPGQGGTFRYMSRDYGYDFAGRVSRVDATDNPTNGSGGLVPAPFYGSYSFDEFGNMKSRSGQYALNAPQTDTSAYLNNRRTTTGWSYDADGRLVSSKDDNTDSNQTWVYDAAGNQKTVTESISSATTTNTLRYDGNGELLFESVATSSNTKSNYLIRSSVLGAVLTKLDSSGNKDITYVPTNGFTNPLQKKDSSGNPVIGWVFRDITGLQEDGKAYDPFGALIQNVQPPTGGGSPPNMPVYGATYGGVTWNSFINANNQSTGCKIDGVRGDCNKLRDGLGNGSIDHRSLMLTTTGGYADFANAGWGGLIMPSVNAGRRWVSDPAPKLASAPKLGTYQKGISTQEDSSSRDPEWTGRWEYWTDVNFFLGASFQEGQERFQFPQRHMKNSCLSLADIVDQEASRPGTDYDFVRALQRRLQARPGTTGEGGYDEFRGDGFKREFQDERNSYNQVRHFVGTFSGAYFGTSASFFLSPIATASMAEGVYQAALKSANLGEDPKNESDRADMAVNTYSVRAGVYLALGRMQRHQAGAFIRNNLCEPK